jgi:hypothetical protein
LLKIHHVLPFGPFEIIFLSPGLQAGENGLTTRLSTGFSPLPSCDRIICTKKRMISKARSLLGKRTRPFEEMIEAFYVNDRSLLGKSPPPF